MSSASNSSATISSEEKYNIGKSVTFWGIGVNLLLTVVKYAVGIMGRSQALIADATHSLGDLLSDFVTLWGLKYSRMPRDWNHPFGHGKIETIASSLVGMALLCVGVMIGWGGIVKTFQGPSSSPTYLALWVAAINLVSKEILYRYTFHYAKKIKSKVVMANAYDHRSDALSSLATVVGIGGAIWGWPILDPLAAAIVSLFILKTGFTITMEAAFELAETSVPQTTLTKIREVVLQAEGVKKVREIRARHVGPDLVIEVDIMVDPTLTVRQGHDIADRVEKEIKKSFEDAGVITVHVEPLR